MIFPSDNCASRYLNVKANETELQSLTSEKRQRSDSSLRRVIESRDTAIQLFAVQSRAERKLEKYSAGSRDIF